ncbi:response regulator [Pedobacter sp. SL55]|uniref:response regulator n=1 Tax=Pedobacter sp. SL55 TaxID=2995161 RepID=UPI00226FC88F|nr:response regulator transcription factor [Pedobacter sp. SL55]WAC38964.1 response regulator transcription factor [Pedobacter sp. SL55]
MKLLLVDDHAIVTDGLQMLLQNEVGFTIVEKLTSGNFALAYLKQNEIDLMITDYSMPDMDGLVLVKQAKALKPNLKIIVLSMHDEAAMIKDMLSAGVDGYVLKKYAQQELLNAVHTVANGKQFWSEEVNKALLSSLQSQANENQPTERELEVLGLLAQEFTSKQIAEKLFISERTVETHRKNLMRKTGANNAIGLVRYAYAHRLI